MSLEPRNLVALELLERVLKSWWTLVGGACIGLAAAVAVLHVLPKTYEATTKIFVAPQKIPSQYVTSTVTDDMATRLSVLQEAVLSRSYMLKLIEQTYGVQENEEQVDLLMLEIRSKLRVKVTQPANLFELTYRDSDPERAAKVVNILTDLYIKQNAQVRATRAAETTETLDEMAAEAQERLLEKEKQIADFKSEHLYETSDYRDANLRLLDTRQRDLEAKETALGTAQDRLQQLQAQQGLGVVSGPTSLAQQEATLKTELAALRLRYSEEHPDVKAKKRELELLLAGGGAPSEAPADESGRTSPATSRASLDIQSQERVAERLAAEVQKTRAELALYQRRIEMTPHVEQQLTELSKGYGVLVKQYEDYRTKAELAKGSQRIEDSQKGQQFEVIDMAARPTLPVQPLPPVIYGLGLLCGLLVFVGPLVASTALRPVVCSQAGLEALWEVPVLAAIPRIATRDTLRAERIRSAQNWGLSLLSAAVLASATMLLG